MERNQTHVDFGRLTQEQTRVVLREALDTLSEDDACEEIAAWCKRVGDDRGTVSELVAEIEDLIE